MPIQDLPVRRCPRCGMVYLEDDRMYEDIDRCPGCGHDLSGSESKTTEEVVLTRI